MILAIDPGPVESAYALLDDDLRPVKFGKAENDFVNQFVHWNHYKHFVIELVASYGMPVGKEVFDTCVWAGRFIETASRANKSINTLYRKDVKINLCGSMKAKDANIRQALIDRFAQHDFKNGKGTKKKPDWFHGFHSDIWAAYSVGVTYYDLHLKNL